MRSNVVIPLEGVLMNGTCVSVVMWCFLWCAMPVSAEKNTRISEKMFRNHSTVKTSVVASCTSFDSPQGLPKEFAVIKGDWRVKNGCLHATEIEADHHAAVIDYQKKNRDSQLRFSFKYDGSTSGFHVSLNKAKGHLFRVIVSSEGFSIVLDKDKKDSQSKLIKLASAKGAIETGKWHTMLVEIKQDAVMVQTDNGLEARASHPSLSVLKPGYRFVMRGDSLCVDDLCIWSFD